MLDQVRDRVRRLGYAKRAETSYVHWIKRYILFHGKRHPRSNKRGQPPVPMSTAVPRN
ncbi:phage integrase N-terminal SAM-like domain-containing protein [Immundisolibacter cernigliae]|uniref:phage integrase N-terminal SAM-like domain-containing protein n=1 Tax=Immundisolibacter cernigliae TaxID=1810504 RepID=UPI0009F26ABA